MPMHHFSVRTKDQPLVASDDKVIVVHREALSIFPVMYIGAHEDSIVEVRSAPNDAGLATATGPAVGDPSTGGTGLFLPAGGKRRFDLPGAGAGPLDLVTQINVLKGKVFIHISSFGLFDTHLKQVDVPVI